MSKKSQYRSLCVAGIMVVGLLMLFTGCATQPVRGFFTTDLRNAGSVYAPKDVFGPGETPVVTVNAYDGKTCTIQLYDLSTGESIDTNTKYIPVGSAWNLSYPWLKKGSYRAMLFVGGVQVASTTFAVEK